MSASPGMAVIKREFLTGLRSPKPFLFLAVLMLIMIGGLVFMLEVVLQTSRAFGGGISTQDVRALFMVFSFGLYFSATLLVPPMAAVSICTEKQQDSYDLLRMTYISPFSLAMAKLFNVLGVYTLVAIATLPVVGVFFFLVGIDWSQFVQSAIVIALSALSSALIGLACSAKFYRTLPAIMTTYAIGFMLQGGLLLGLVLIAEVFFPYTWISELFRQFDDEFLALLCPMGALAVVGEGRLPPGTLVLMIIYHGAVIAAGLALTLAILRRPVEPMRVDQEKPIDDQALLQARRKSFPYYLIDPRRRRPAIPDHGNPVYFKELQTGLLGKGTFSVRIFYGFTIFCLVVSVFAVTVGGFGGRDYAAFVAWPVLVDTVLILVLTPALVAMAMAREHEWGNLDMLRMTLLDPAQIIGGKFRTALYTAFIPVFGAIVGSAPLAVFAYHSHYAWAAAFTGFTTMAVCVIYVLALTLAATVTCRRGISALMLGYGASVAALVLLPLAALLALGVMNGSRFNFTTEEILTLSFLSPLAANFVNILETHLLSEELLFNPYWFFNSIFFLVASAAALGVAMWRFTRHLARGVG